MATRRISKQSSRQQSSTQSRQKTIFIDLDDKPAKAKVSRKGYQVPPVKPHPERIDRFIGDLEILRPTESPRVLTQSVAPGTKVGPGTVIDLVMAVRTDVPMDIFDDIHIDLRPRRISDLIEAVQKDPKISEVTLKYEDPDTIPEDEKNSLIRRLQQTELVSIDDSVPERSFNKAFNALRTALAFS